MFKTYGPPSRDAFIKTIKIRDQVLLKFREMCSEEYVFSLRENCKDLHETNNSEIIKTDVFLIKKKIPDKPRLYWLLVKIVDLFHGENNKIHSVNMKRRDGLTQKYSIKHLYPLELTLTYNFHLLSPELGNLNTIHHAQKERRVFSVENG